MNIVQQFSEVVQRFQSFFDVLDEIDKSTWRLEPEHPTYASTMRRLALGKSLCILKRAQLTVLCQGGHASIQIEIDPKSPRSVPECRLLGSDSIVGPLRERFGQNLHRWCVQS